MGHAVVADRSEPSEPLASQVLDLGVAEHAHTGAAAEGAGSSRRTDIVDEGREGGVHRRDLLGGLLHEYWRAA